MYLPARPQVDYPDRVVVERGHEEALAGDINAEMIHPALHFGQENSLNQLQRLWCFLALGW